MAERDRCPIYTATTAGAAYQAEAPNPNPIPNAAYQSESVSEEGECTDEEVERGEDADQLDEDDEAELEPPLHREGGLVEVGAEVHVPVVVDGRSLVRVRVRLGLGFSPVVLKG